MSDKINFKIEPERTGTGVLKVGNLEPRDYTQNEDILSKADRFDSTNVSGRLRLNDTNFYNYRKFYTMKKRELDDEGKKQEDMSSFAYTHQIQTVETVLKLPSGGLLADQVGMGKTIEAGMLIAELAYRDEWRVLVITLSNDELIRNWHDEMYEKFGLNLAILRGKDENDVKGVFEALRDYQKSGICRDMNGSTQETVNTLKCTYKGVLIPFSYLVHPKFLELVDRYNAENADPFHVDLIVVDESHRYTSHQGIASSGDYQENPISALHKLQMKQKVMFNGEEREKKLGRILLLTATPIKNDLHELLTLMQIIDPKYKEEDFRKELGLREDQEFTLTSVLENSRGVNRWWEWFSKFGERHTRITTMYDPQTRRLGVKWKKKNSYSYYFNNDSVSEVRPYFLEDGAVNVIKRVSGEAVARENMESRLKGVRKANVVHYTDIIPDFDMAKFRRYLMVVSYLKHEITLEELKKVPFDQMDDGISAETLEKNILSKKDFNAWKSITWKTIDDPQSRILGPHLASYDELGNAPDEIEVKKCVENAVSKFFENLLIQPGNASKFFDSFFRYLKAKIPNQQRDRNGIDRAKTFDNLAIILCADDFFLQMEKLLTLGNIINSPENANEKVIIFCKDDAERRMLVENSFLWDFKNRYRDNQSVSTISRASRSSLDYVKNLNVVSIAYTTDAEGLNLQSYHTMINYSIVLSPLHMEQRIGRIDRIGQTSEMNVYFLANAQDVEGYVLRFFEYELELFSNWSGDTTASTYVDDKTTGQSVDFDEYAVSIWNAIWQNDSIAASDKIRIFEENISVTFNQVRSRVINIAKYSKDIDNMKIIIEEPDNEEIDDFFAAFADDAK